MIDQPHLRDAKDWNRMRLRQTVEHRDALNRVLGVAHGYAAAPFVLIERPHGRCLAAALSPPPLLCFEALRQWDDDPDSDIILIDGGTGNVELAGDPGSSWVLGDLPYQTTVTLFTDGRRFARAWAANRQAHIDRLRLAAVPGLKATDAPQGGLPGYVMTGRLDRVTRWGPLRTAQRVLIDNPSLVRTLQSTLIRAARVPTVEAFMPTVSKAAA